MTQCEICARLSGIEAESSTQIEHLYRETPFSSVAAKSASRKVAPDGVEEL